MLSARNLGTRTHVFAKHTYKSPTWCDECGDFLWGLMNQGYCCSGCKWNMHQKCAAKYWNLLCVPGAKPPSLSKKKESSTSSPRLIGSNESSRSLLQGTLPLKITIPTVVGEDANQAKGVLFENNWTIRECITYIVTKIKMEIAPGLGLYCPAQQMWLSEFQQLGSFGFESMTLLQYSVRPDAPLWVLVKFGEDENLKRRLAKAEYDEIVEANELEETPLHIACWVGNVFALKEILKKRLKEKDLDAVDGTGCTALMIAARQGHLSCVETLLSEKVDIHLQNKSTGKYNGYNAFHFLVCHSPPNKDEGSDKKSIVTEHAYTKILPKFIDKGTSLYARISNGNCALHLACAYNNYTAASFIISKSFLVDITNSQGETSLHIAVQQDNYQLVKLLLDAGADQHVLTKDGKTPLDFCDATTRNYAIFQELADIPTRMIDLYEAIRDDSLMEVKDFITNDAVTVNEAIIWCAIRCRLNIMKALFEMFPETIDFSYKNKYGFDAVLCFVRILSPSNEELYFQLLNKMISKSGINQHKNKRLDTPLHLACLTGNAKVVLKLFQHGAPANNVNKFGETELHYVVIAGMFHIVPCLIGYGADPNIQATSGETPLGLAQKTHQSKILKFFQTMTEHNVSFAKNLPEKGPNTAVVTVVYGQNLSKKDKVFVVLKHYRKSTIKKVKSTVQGPEAFKWEESFEFMFRNTEGFADENVLHVEVLSKKTNEVLSRGMFTLKPKVKTLEICLRPCDETEEESGGTLTFRVNFLAKTPDLVVLNKGAYLPLNADEKVASMKEATGSTRVGEAKAKLGFTAQFPVVIIPGLASSSLEAWDTTKSGWRKQRVWIDPFKIGTNSNFDLGKALGLASSKKKAQEEKKEELGRAWLKHMMVEDGWKDPQGIKIRPIEGLHAIDYLVEGVFAKASYVFAYVIQALIDVGYDICNLKAAPYDWRIPPEKLQARDGYFSKLRRTIQTSYKVNKARVVLMAHSMGNRCAQYFLEWVESQSPGWVNEHIHAFLSMGAPFLGATKSVRAVISGDAMSLDMFITLEEGRELAQNAGSTPWLYPLKEDLFFPDVVARVRQDRNEVKSRSDSQHKFKNLNTENALRQFAPKSYDFFKRYYENNDLYLKVSEGGSSAPVLSRPPVDNLWIINGVNVETEVTYYYREHSLDPSHASLDVSADKYSGKKLALINPRGLKIKGGIGYETKNTYQPFFRTNKSGDGTVPYASLSYWRVWKEQAEKKKIPFNVTVVEVDGAKHREMLAHDVVLDEILNFVCKPPDSAVQEIDLFKSSEMM